MANIKRVLINGELPFDAGGDQELLQVLGQLSLPSMGLKVEWGGHRSQPNEHGGKTAMYRFTLKGDEAVRDSYLTRFVDLVHRAGGGSIVGTYEDLEAGGRFVWTKEGWVII